KALLPGEKKRELNRGLLLRVWLQELDAKALVITADVVSVRAAAAARVQGTEPLRLVNLPVAGNATITDGKNDMKFSDLKRKSLLLLQLEGVDAGDAIVVTGIRVERTSK